VTKRFPRLKYPLDRRGLSFLDGMALLNYDILHRWLTNAYTSHMSKIEALTLINDTEANLNALGAYLVETLGKDRFEDEITEDGSIFGA
jgi:hypothetical protein